MGPPQLVYPAALAGDVGIDYIQGGVQPWTAVSGDQPEMAACCSPSALIVRRQRKWHFV